MKSLRFLAGAVIGVWVAAGWTPATRAQTGLFGSDSGEVVRTSWEQRVLRHGQMTRPRPLNLDEGQTAGRGRVWTPVTAASTTLTFEPESEAMDAGPIFDDAEPIPPGQRLNPMPMDPGYAGQGYAGQEIYGPDEFGLMEPGYGPDYGPGCGGCGEVGCSECGDGYYGYGHGCGGPFCFALPLLRRLTLHAGVHGFKGPTDMGLNGNFGLEEGLGTSGPLGDPWGIGYQVGVNVVHSNFSGFQTLGEFSGSDRNQVFLTAGLFRRPVCGWWQWGLVFDYYHDSYYDTADIEQIRSETSLRLGDCREIGYWGAYSVGRGRFNGVVEAEDFTLKPTDLFSFFYRRKFSGGGKGRLWAGFTGDGDGLLGGDAVVPIGTSWALENHFTYLIPNEGDANGGQSEESWAVAIRLVWYPGRSAACEIQDRYHPMFYVADNNVFLVDRE